MAEAEGEGVAVVMGTKEGITNMGITGGQIGITMMTGLREMNKNGKIGSLDKFLAYSLQPLKSQVGSCSTLATKMLSNTATTLLLSMRRTPYNQITRSDLIWN